MTAELVLLPVKELDLVYREWRWPFAHEHRNKIDAHFTEARRAKPEMFNGQILMARDPVFAGDTFSARYFQTDFASFLAWRDWGFPDASVFNGFGMGALRTSDGAFVLGEMGQHTANAGKIYFPAGTPDLNDLRGDAVDIPGSVTRETAEEVGLTPDDYRAADQWDVVQAGSLMAMIRILDLAVPGDAVRARIEASLATQDDQELSAIHLVRSVSDFTETMPAYIRAFLAAKL
ncbi:NUDIX hydrolase [Tardiphaga sp. 813_E8_N1_3]|uniref:NUDIX hydrolase n=1 Tax=Tardiphaga sp. 813_E8_N1_3 TaxID=3240760 RepID=UPI003F275882